MAAKERMTTDPAAREAHLRALTPESHPDLRLVSVDLEKDELYVVSLEGSWKGTAVLLPDGDGPGRPVVKLSLQPDPYAHPLEEGRILRSMEPLTVAASDCPLPEKGDN